MAQIISRIEEIHKMNRPIIVFFNSTTELWDFFNSPQYEKFDHLRKITLPLTQHENSSTRLSRIQYASEAGSITLMIKQFGRGTDFQVLDDDVQANGGVHIIQTFLSDEEAEEIQIKGRTNRQNSPGSTDIIYIKDELEKLAINHSLNGRNNHEISKILLEARQKKANQGIDNVLSQEQKAK